ncbi:DsbA family protein [Candidatus Woesearchaeota archaeon]|jgi:hypothetical protein|nr:DsbA family protein [Candidatus Woesearchaeota archaeon]MBT5272489.1 DsbA family protein [Candidatus Woesearchaeota archaeon]MBT6041503.1 DsbA family protein [Candidatus Woesearchaeota archaeon]MBT6336351.1 DsbA family protein [Candidatus Woesearchaeota archaeon]MBT7928253.1 DsbA family protein [Candidatus Woesearchaeota archaeon]
MKTYNPLKIALEGLAIATLFFAFNGCGSERVVPIMTADTAYDLFLPDYSTDSFVDIISSEFHTKPGDDSFEDGSTDISLDELAQQDVLDTKDSIGLDGINKDLPGIDDISDDILIVYSGIVNSDDPVLGSSDAPVTIVMFGGYKCPYSKLFHDETLPSILDNYISQGVVNFVFKDMPLDFHEYSTESAEAAECAKEQGMFWEYHDLLFLNQETLNENTFELLAEQLGMDMDLFNQSYSSGKYSAQVQADFDKAVETGVLGTPSFFVNGKNMVQGNQHYSVFEKAIEKELGM